MSAERAGTVRSGFRDLVGYRVEEWSEGRAVVAVTLGDEHSNRSGYTHGGVYTTIIDAACGMAGCWCPHEGRERRAVTLTLNTAFLRPARTGKTIRAVATVRGGGRSIYTAAADVLDDAGHLIATGQGTFRYRRGSETTRGVANDEPQ